MTRQGPAVVAGGLATSASQATNTALATLNTSAISATLDNA